MYFKVKTVETIRDSLKDEAYRFTEDIDSFETLDEVKEFIIDKYGKIPKRRTLNTVYQDPDRQPVGFLRSYWNKDSSYQGKSRYQTDWVTITAVTETPVLIN